MSKRKTLEVPGVSHVKSPIPLAAQIGNIIFSSAITGKDPATSALPDNVKKEVEYVFQNVTALMASAGATTDDIIKMSVSLKDDDDLRAMFNEAWLKMFPNADDRPARHISIVDLPRGMNVQVEVVGVILPD